MQLRNYNYFFDEDFEGTLIFIYLSVYQLVASVIFPNVSKQIGFDNSIPGKSVRKN